MKILVLWTELSGYLNCCLRQTAAQYDVELFVVRRQSPKATDRHYDDAQFAWMPTLRVHDGREKTLEPALVQEILAFAPDAVLVSGWFVDAYVALCVQLRARGVRVVAGLDNQWRQTPRQLAGIALRRAALHKAFDALWVTGERAAELARRLGFSGNRLLYGIYSADIDLFTTAQTLRTTPLGVNRIFLFVGRYVPAKGIQDLITAYQQYRTMTDDPWTLWCVGSGPQAALVDGCDGAVNKGFVQPDALPELMARASVFVLPSHYEPWGVVVHEAAAAGLPIVSTYKVGSSVELVEDGYNGWLLEHGNAPLLAQRMFEISSGRYALAQMGENSAKLAQRYSPQRWTETLMRFAERTQVPLPV